ncbi:MAG TPA: hypothetical protein VJX47_05560 [Candidatus Sulfotelmatobacter sp.]|nr:hypothetical protein [Candidatus Sulfotelmatobacter sp.]
MSPARFDNSAPGSSPIQFGTAEYLGSPGADHCQFCQQPITGTYYRVHGAMACRGCAEKAQSELPQYSHADYLRGLLYGVGAAIAGLILYAAFEIATSLIIGYVSLAVGWMVGKAMMKGSNGQGGRRYQITAALLTYAAVSMAAIPVWIHYAGEHKQAQHASQQQQLADEQRELEKDTGRPQTPAPAKPALNIGKAFVTLAVLGLASPFLELADPLHGAIGLFILFIGIRIAWQLTGQKIPAIDGPFQSSPRPPAGVSAG